jgi:hypothetical protein
MEGSPGTSKKVGGNGSRKLIVVFYPRRQLKCPVVRLFVANC